MANELVRRNRESVYCNSVRFTMTLKLKCTAMDSIFVAIEKHTGDAHCACALENNAYTSLHL